MTKYVLKRIGISIVTVFVLVSVVFFLARLMPGGPFNDPKLSETAKANLSAYYGFDKPLWEQYLTYLSNLLHGNFGFSTKYPSRTVNDLLAGAFPYSADLGIRALCFAISFGLVFGIISALSVPVSRTLLWVRFSSISLPSNGGCSQLLSTRDFLIRFFPRWDLDFIQWRPSRGSCVPACWR